jgi:hypothetical protein
MIINISITPTQIKMGYQQKLSAKYALDQDDRPCAFVLSTVVVVAFSGYIFGLAANTSRSFRDVLMGIECVVDGPKQHLPDIAITRLSVNKIHLQV